MSCPPYALERLGVVMERDPDDPQEAWGVLNPASARGADGELYLFPRLVAEGNYSRIGRARVRFENGVPAGADRLGLALEPQADWERNAQTGGVEDPRITFVARLGLYLMTYTAYGRPGPRVAIAASPDLEHWKRLGRAAFAPDPAVRTDFGECANKDAVLFPEPVRAPDGVLSYALLHRPAWDDEAQAGIWISFTPADEVEQDSSQIIRLRDHRPVAFPEQPWEELKIGAGPPPVRSPEGWLLLYHGVSGRIVPDVDLQPAVRYAAGALVLDPDEVWEVTARSREPLLEPETREERDGIVPNVVFPTALDERSDGTADVYYGMADSRIGAARLRRTGPSEMPGRPDRSSFRTSSSR